MAFSVALISFPVMDFGLVDGQLRPIGMDLFRECPPLSIYWLPVVLRAVGIEVVPIDLIAPGTLLGPREIENLIGCDLVGVTATSMSWPAALDGIKKIKAAYPNARIVAGGPHPSLFDEYVIKNGFVDFVIRGEGERSLPALCDALCAGKDLANVPSLSWRNSSGHFIRNKQGNRLTREDLSALPPPDYEPMPSNIYQGLSLESSRGCPYDCAFCSTNYRTTYRPHSADAFVSSAFHILPHVERTRLKMIHIVDDEFSMNQRRAIQIADELTRTAFPARFCYDARANDLLNEELVEKMGPHTYEFLVGAECGYEEGLAKIGKGTTLPALEKAAKNLFRYGYSERAHFSFILGFPWEGRREIDESISFAKHLCLTYGVKVLIQWYLQIPGSNLWAEARKGGQVSPSFYDDFGFFRNAHLFFSGVRIHPNDIWEVSEIINTIKWIAKLNHKHPDPMSYSIPGPVATHFPRGFDAGFDTLRHAVS